MVGRKNDADKPDFRSLLTYADIMHIGLAGGSGIIKYGLGNEREMFKDDPIRAQWRYLQACGRHVLAELRGQHDPESGQEAGWHALCCVWIMLQHLESLVKGTEPELEILAAVEAPGFAGDGVPWVGDSVVIPAIPDPTPLPDYPPLEPSPAEGSEISATFYDTGLF